MDQEKFNIAVEEALKNVFGYYHSPYGLTYKIDEEWDKVKQLPRSMKAGKSSSEKVSKKVSRQFIIRISLSIVVGIILGATTRVIEKPSLNLIVVVVATLELVIGAGVVGLVVMLLYKKLKKIRAKKKKEKEEIEKQKLLETLSNLDTDIYKKAVEKNLREIKKILKDLKDDNVQKASNLLTREDMRKRLCPALKSVTDDVFDISKSITPVLVGCVVSGTILIPLNPVLFAAIAVVIARMGISALCTGYITK